MQGNKKNIGGAETGTKELTQKQLDEIAQNSIKSGAGKKNQNLILIGKPAGKKSTGDKKQEAVMKDRLR